MNSHTPFRMKNSRTLQIGASVALLAIVACSSSPTGRKQLTLLPDSQMNTMGAQSFAALKQQTKSASDPALTQYVQCVVEPMLKNAEDPTGVKSWEVEVFKDDSPNAFALPGGKIGVHTGMLKIAKTDAQLAAVLGHEVGHVIARHGNERVSQGVIAQGAMVAADAFTGNSAQKPLLMGLLGIGTQVGVLLPFSRSHETEADRIGMNLMTEAGYNPQAAVELWENMAKAGGGAPPEFLSTHPSNQTRIQKLKEQIPEVQAEYEAVAKAGNTPKCKRPAGY